MSDDELDYMSDAFVCINPDADIRPGLNPKLKRIKQIEESRRENSPISRKHLEKEKREDALQKPLSADNKGFAMLTKMGFKPGSGLGKSGEGRAEPVPLNIKNDRKGLGRKLILEEVAALKAKLKETRNAELNVDDYRKRIVSEANIRTCKIDLSKSQRACYTLDSKEGITEPEEDWFWEDKEVDKGKEVEDSEESPEDDEEEEIDQELSIQDKLYLLTLYLRRSYLYCIWCGTQYDDDDDLQQECPGATREDH